MRALRLLLVTLFLVAAAGCGDSSRVGEGINVEELDAAQERLGEFLADEEAPEEGGGFLGRQDEESGEASGPDQGTDAGDAQAAQEEARRQQIEQAAVEFSITVNGFDPYYMRVFRGGVVRVVNRDAQERSVTADQGEFDSGPLRPGEDWIYEADTVGRFNFHDSTRPYVVGTLEVLDR